MNQTSHLLRFSNIYKNLKNTILQLFLNLLQKHISTLNSSQFFKKQIFLYHISVSNTIKKIHYDTVFAYNDLTLL